MAERQTLIPASELAKRKQRPLSERERRVSPGAQRAPGRGDRAEAPHRAGGGAAPRAASGGQVTKDYRFQGEAGPVTFADLFGAPDTRRLQLHVRTAARTALPDVHLAAERMGRRGARRRPAGRTRGSRPLADRATGRVQAERGWRQPQPLRRRQRRLHARLCRRRGRGYSSVQRVQPPRWHDPPFLEQRDGRQRPPIPARTRAAPPT